MLHSASSASALEPASARDHVNVDTLTRSWRGVVEGVASAGKAASIPSLQLRKRPAQGPTRLESAASGAPGVLYSPHLPQAREAVSSTLHGSFQGGDSTASLRSPRCKAGPSPRAGLVGTISAPTGIQSRSSHADLGHPSSAAAPSSPGTQERMVSARGLPGGVPQFWSKSLSAPVAAPVARGVSPASVATAAKPLTRGASPTAAAQPLTRGVSPTSVGPPSRMVSAANASTAEHGGVAVTVSPRLVSTAAPTVASAAARVVRPQAHTPHSVQSQSTVIKATPVVPWQGTITRSPSMLGIEPAASAQISLA